MGVAARRERERELRRNQILDAAKHIFAEKGLSLATMDDVATHAQLGKGTLYLYFKNKEELLMGVVVRLQARMLARFDDVLGDDQNGCEQLRALLRAYADHMNEPPHAFKLAVSRWLTGVPFDDELENSSAMQSNIARLFMTVCGAIERGQADGSLRPDLPSTDAALKLWTAVNGTLLFRLQRQCLPPDSPLSSFPGKASEAIDFILEAMKPHLATGAKT
jgi:AcrR family transcriptional regulator